VGALTWALCVSLTILSHRETLFATGPGNRA
jgi:hypothetical protein